MRFKSGFDGQGKPFPIPNSTPNSSFSWVTVPWWHTIPLPDGSYTKGAKSIDVMRHEAALYFDGVDLAGKSFIDIGAWNGGFSVEAKHRGAKKMTALDRFHLPELESAFQVLSSICFIDQEWGLNLDLFAVNLDNPNLNLSSLGKFDVVFFAGVFYHLLNPLTAMREVASLATDVLIVETWIDNTMDDRPGMIFYPGAEINNDTSNWWGPNIPFMVQYLNVLGFPKVDVIPNELDKNRGIFRAYRSHEVVGRNDGVIDFTFER